MVDVEKVLLRLELLRRYLHQLRELSASSPDDLLGDSVKLGAVKYYLQVAIQSALDIANHLIATEGGDMPPTYADYFQTLGRMGLLPADFVPILVDLAKFRNVLVHGYGEVEDGLLWSKLSGSLSALDRYASMIAAHIAEQG